MSTLKDQFYELANCLNRVTMPAGCIKEILGIKPLTKLSQKDLTFQQEKLISIFEQIENAAFSANQKIIELKNYIYKIATPETELQ